MKTLVAVVGEAFILFPDADEVEYILGGIRVAKKDQTFYITIDQPLPVQTGEINFAYDVDEFHQEMANLIPLNSSGEPRSEPQ